MPREIGINRLARLLENFATENELPLKKTTDTFRLGVPAEGKLVHLRFTFHPSEDGYEFGTPLLKVNQNDQPDFSTAILHSEPIRGLTERIVGERFYVLGSRDGLKMLPDEEITRAFANDVSRVSKYYSQVKGLIEGK